MTERSVLRVREREHIHPKRQGETVIEVLRGGEVVAVIYGSREGIHVVSDLGPRNRPLLVTDAGPTPCWIVPLLAEGETCPWCKGRKWIAGGAGGQDVPCPVCA